MFGTRLDIELMSLAAEIRSALKINEEKQIGVQVHQCVIGTGEAQATK